VKFAYCFETLLVWTRP